MVASAEPHIANAAYTCSAVIFLISSLNMKIMSQCFKLFRWILSDNYTKLLLTNEITVKWGSFLFTRKYPFVREIWRTQKWIHVRALDCARQIKSPAICNYYKTYFYYNCFVNKINIFCVFLRFLIVNACFCLDRNYLTS